LRWGADVEEVEQHRLAGRLDGGAAGIDIDGASAKLDLTTLETLSLPLKAA